MMVDIEEIPDLADILTTGQLDKVRNALIVTIVEAIATGGNIEVILQAIKTAIEGMEIDIGDIENLNVEMNVLMDQVELYLAQSRGSVAYAAGVTYGPENMALIELTKTTSEVHGVGQFLLTPTTAMSAVKVGDHIALSGTPAAASDGTFDVVGVPDGISVIISPIPGRGEPLVAFTVVAGVTAVQDVVTSQIIALTTSIDAFVDSIDTSITAASGTIADPVPADAIMLGVEDTGNDIAFLDKSANGLEVDVTASVPIPVLPSSKVQGVKTAPTVTATALGGAAALTRGKITVTSEISNDPAEFVYVGYTGVTALNGQELQPGDSVDIEADDVSEVFVIGSAAAQDVRYVGG